MRSVHCASGVIADSTRVLRMLLNRIEDVNTGEVLVPELHCEIPPAHEAYLESASGILKEGVSRLFLCFIMFVVALFLCVSGMVKDVAYWVFSDAFCAGKRWK